MKILVTGAKGQLGIDLVDILSKLNEVVGLAKEDLNIVNLDNVINVIREIKPDLIINAAAYTNVDGCSENKDLAYKINAIGPRNLAIAALENSVKLLHISTDFIFDGEKNEPYVEFDKANPLSIYGNSKLAGEEFIKEICSRHYILRTSWLYGENGNNFVKTMLKMSETNKMVRVVDDQIGSPTYTKDLVNVIGMLMKTEEYGTYHVSNDGQCSWNEFAKKIFQYAEIKEMEIVPITSEELNRPAKRPKYSVLKNYMLELGFNFYIRHWDDALKEYFMRVGQ